MQDKKLILSWIHWFARVLLQVELYDIDTLSHTRVASYDPFDKKIVREIFESTIVFQIFHNYFVINCDIKKHFLDQ